MTVIGCPREIKSGEFRVGLTPDAARALVEAGHLVDVETRAGEGSRFPDEAYQRAGGRIVGVREAWVADLVLGMKEPQPSEYGYLRDSVVFRALHLAVLPDLVEALCAAGTTAIALEGVTDDDGRYPILAPLSAIAGRLAVQVGAQQLLGWGGRLLAGAPGSAPCQVMVVGAGEVGRVAANVAVGMGAEVTVLDRDPRALRLVEHLCATRIATEAFIGLHVQDTDLLIGAVAVNGARAPVVVTREMVRSMRPGSVIVDVAVDQGGCVETTAPTTWAAPAFTCEGVRHVGISNLPGGAPVDGSRALSHATLSYVMALADSLAADGTIGGALERFPGLSSGLSVAGGEVVHEAVKRALAPEPAHPCPEYPGECG